jgi:hypothetical protein
MEYRDVLFGQYRISFPVQYKREAECSAHMRVQKAARSDANDIGPTK